MMRLERVAAYDNSIRGKAFMVLTCKDESQLDRVVNHLNKDFRREWGTVYEEGDKEGQMQTQYIVCNEELDWFKEEYKAAKKAEKSFK